MSQDSTNYHSFLGEIKDVFDPVLLALRNQDEKEWKWLAWTGPWKNIKSVFKAAGPISKVFMGASPLVGPGAIAAAVLFFHLPAWVIISIGALILLVLIFLIYWLLVHLYAGKMASMGNPEFHIGAFKAKRPLEYRLWAPFFQKHNATFSSLYHYLTPILTSGSKESIDSIAALAQAQVETATSNADQYRSDRDYLQSEVLRYEKAVGFLVGMVKAINKSLYRLVNGVMNHYELNFVSAFTIYEVDGSVIRKLYDHWTTGSSPKEIALTGENAAKYAAVFVAMQPEGEDSFSYNKPFPGRTVASYRMKMLEGKTWIWNFHFDDSDDRALKLALSDDIIEVREVYRLVHAFCLILQKQEIEGREGHQHGRGKTSESTN